MDANTPLVLVYTGDGKGKTSAALGQVVRARGHGMRVAFCQCMKRPGAAGEQAFLSELLGEDFLAGGLGFFRKEEDRPAHREAVLSVLKWAMEKIRAEGMFVCIMDEALYAHGSGLVTQEELEQLLFTAAANQVHLVLTGRNCPSWLQERAHLVSEIAPRKHPYEQGIPAVEGIDY